MPSPALPRRSGGRCARYVDKHYFAALGDLTVSEVGEELFQQLRLVHDTAD